MPRSGIRVGDVADRTSSTVRADEILGRDRSAAARGDSLRLTEALGLLRGLVAWGATVVLATHDERAWRACDRVVPLSPHPSLRI